MAPESSPHAERMSDAAVTPSLRSSIRSAIEAIACIKTIEENVIHPTINYETFDPDCDLDYVPNEARSANVKNVLSNNFGFGGQNACLVFSRFDG